MAAVDELAQAVSGVAQTAGGAVVGIGRGWGLGSGIVVGDGLVLTNAHNLRSEEVDITFADGRTARGTVAGADVDGDLAVVSVDTGATTPLEWADGEPPAVGTVVFALANPGGRGLRVTLGTVSSAGRSFRGPRGRRITGAWEHTAPLARGSSGGPVVDASGRLLGVNTNRLGEGFYLAVPADASLRGRLDSLARGDVPARRRLGLGIVPGRAARQLRRAVGLPDRDGVLVRVVEDDAPAARAGLRQGDLIVAAGGRAVASADDLYEALDALDDGSLSLAVVRGTEELEVSVTFGATREEGSA